MSRVITMDSGAPVRSAARGWSQEVLAQLSGLHRTYISSVERTQRNISIDNLEKLATAFDLTVGDLLATGRSDLFDR